MRALSGNLPAFPFERSNSVYDYATGKQLQVQPSSHNDGLSRRELMATLALQGLLSNPNLNLHNLRDLAAQAVRASEALLIELEKI